MSTFWTVFKYEFSVGAKKKGFIITNIIICLLIFGGLTFFARVVIGDMIGSEGSEDGAGSEDFKYAYINNYEGDINLSPLLDSKVFVKADSESDLKKMINDEKVDEGVVIGKDGEMTIYKNSSTLDFSAGNGSNMSMEFDDPLADLVNRAFVTGVAEKYGFSQSEIEPRAFTVVSVSGESTNQGGAILSVAWSLVLYFLILIFGQLAATSVAKEKDNRTMEILITAASPLSLLNGKVLAYSAMGLTSLALYILSGYLAYLFNASILEGFVSFIFDALGIQAGDLIMTMVMAILGYLLYMYLFSGLGALVTKLEDLNASCTPVILLFISGFFASMYVSPDSLAGKIISYVPFWATMTTPKRLFAVGMSTVEVVIAFAILATTTVVVALLSTKLYRAGTLNYGKKLSIKEALRKKVD